MIKAKILSDGFLKITADNESRNDLKQFYIPDSGGIIHGYPKAEDYVIESLHDNFYFVLPEQIGALTSAPIFTDDLDIDDDGKVAYVGDVFWYPNYMLIDPWEELKNKGYVVFEPEENNKSLEQGPNGKAICGKCRRVIKEKEGYWIKTINKKKVIFCEKCNLLYLKENKENKEE